MVDALMLDKVLRKYEKAHPPLRGESYSSWLKRVIVPVVEEKIGKEAAESTIRAANSVGDN
jgi:hypothetical protein